MTSHLGGETSAPRTRDHLVYRNCIACKCNSESCARRLKESCWFATDLAQVRWRRATGSGPPTHYVAYSPNTVNGGTHTYRGLLTLLAAAHAATWDSHSFSAKRKNCMKRYIFGIYFLFFTLLLLLLNLRETTISRLLITLCKVDLNIRAYIYIRGHNWITHNEKRDPCFWFFFLHDDVWFC